MRRAQGAPYAVNKWFFFADFASSRLCVDKSMLARLRAISGLWVNLRMSTDLEVDSSVSGHQHGTTLDEWAG